MNKIILLLLFCNAAVAGDGDSPFAEPSVMSDIGQNQQMTDRIRVVGVAILEQHAVAVLQLADGQFHTVKAGDSIGGASVSAVMIDKVTVIISGKRIDLLVSG